MCNKSYHVVRCSTAVYYKCRVESNRDPVDEAADERPREASDPRDDAGDDLEECEDTARSTIGTSLPPPPPPPPPPLLPFVFERSFANFAEVAFIRGFVIAPHSS